MKNFNLDEELKNCKSINDITGKNGLVQKLIKGMIEKLLEEEMKEHLGYEKHSSMGNNSGNNRNGKNSKKIKSSFGYVNLDVPRDRNGDFSPALIKKRQTDISSFDEKIISMYSKGMTTRDIQDHIKEIYGTDLSPTMVSHITGKVLAVANEWQSRPLESVYPIVFFDAIHYKVRENGKIVSKAAYTCLGIDLEGKKDILGLWIGDNEGASFWAQICAELKNRGVKDIFIACIDGLKGLPDAIKCEFPKVEIQLCIIHMIRNSMKYVSYKNVKEFISNLKDIYKSPTEKTAEFQLNVFQEKWNEKYPLAVKPWIKHWENVKTFLKFPDKVKKLIYTTNAVEALHRQFRKVTKTRAIFPSDEALFKMLFLAAKDVSKKWTSSVRDWKSVLTHLSLVFGERLNPEERPLK